MNLNHVQLAGRLVRDPDALRYTPSGSAVADISIAVNRFLKDDQGATKELTDFINVTAFGRTAETVQKYLRKGSEIYVEGHLKLDQWDDKQTGAKRSKLKVIADQIQFVGPRPTTASDSPPAAKPAAPAPPAAAPVKRQGPVEPDLDEMPYDVPF